MKKIFSIIYLIVFLILTTNIAYGYPNCIYITVEPSTTQFQLIDPTGNKTGYEPSINGIVENIPNTMYTTQQLTTISDKPWGNIYHKLEPIHTAATYSLVTGKYQLKIFSANTIDKYSYGITIYYEQAANDMRYSQNNRTIIYPNIVWTYEFDVPATPINNGELIPIKISTPTNLIKDLTTAEQLGYIGNKQFASKLVQTVKKIEQDKIKFEKDDISIPIEQMTKNEYQKLLLEITEKYNKPDGDKYVKKEAYDVLKEDLDYIIGQLVIID